VTLTPVSVIVVSRGRPQALARCLRGIAGLAHRRFEVIVVADPAGLSALAPWRDRIRTIAFDRPNISAARNLGLAAAAGDIVAFLDDDAVPEPLWLSRLTDPFGDAAVGAAGGFVIGRNGISLQWGASLIDRLGQRRPIDMPPDQSPVIRRAEPGFGVKTEGTNMAFRRDVLARIGGFDERFAFYLDEGDVNLRLGALGIATAIVPLAQVHHGFAPSDRRRADRVPRDLTEIGASLAVFLAKHGTDPALRLAPETEAQRRRLLSHMVAGRIEPRDVGALLATFRAGWSEGLARAQTADAGTGRGVTGPAPPFLPFLADPPGTGRHTVLAGRSWQARRLDRTARKLAAEGGTVTLLLLSPTALFHRAGFTPGGYWLQRGGLFGRSLRSDPLVRAWRFGQRIARETARIAPVRGEVATP
jgi:GT2 family glycosyltransferase